MRISPEMIQYFHDAAEKLGHNAEAYLYGSRTDDKKKGGDVDILILADVKFDWKVISDIWWGFQVKFGEQKLDIAGFTRDEKDPFKEYVLKHALKL